MIKKHIITSLILLLGLFCFSQDVKQDSARIITDKVEVLKQYEAAILQANRKTVTPKKESTTHSPISYNYNITTEKLIDFDRPDPEIRVLKLSPSQEAKEDIKDGYVYAGYGTHKSIIGGAAYHYYIEDWLEGGFQYDHSSASDSLSSWNRNIGKAYLGYFLSPKTKVGLDLKGDFTSPNFSVFRDTTAMISGAINKYALGLKLGHFNYEEKGLTVRVGLDTKFTNNTSTTNHQDFIYGANLNIIKSISPSSHFEIPIIYTSTNGENDFFEAVDFNVSEIVIRPNYNIVKSKYQFKLGLEFIKTDSTNYLFPLVSIELLNLIPNLKFKLYTDSQYERNSLYNITSENPFVLGRSLDYSFNYLRSYNLSSSYTYSNLETSLTFSYNNYDNTRNYGLGFLTSSFSLVDIIDREEIVINPKLIYNPTEEIEFGLDFRYNIFLTDSLDLFYQPDYTLRIHGSQQLANKKLTLKETIHLNGSSNFRTIDSIESLESFIDLSLELKYRISNSFDLFAKGTNLLSAEYHSFNQIPIYQRQFWAGIKYRI